MPPREHIVYIRRINLQTPARLRLKVYSFYRLCLASVAPESIERRSSRTAAQPPRPNCACGEAGCACSAPRMTSPIPQTCTVLCSPHAIIPHVMLYFGQSKDLHDRWDIVGEAPTQTFL